MTDRENYSNNEKISRCELKDSKRVVSVSEAFLTEDDLKLYKPKTRPPVPTVKDTILIPNQANVKPLVPTVNETVLLDKQFNLISTRKQKVDTKLNESVEEQNSDNIKVTDAKLFIDKKKKERAEKNKLDLIEKKKFLEDRKRRLDQLQKTTKELAKGKKLKKQKITSVENENKSEENVPVETYQPKPEIKTIDQTWSPPQSPLSTLPKSCKKARKTPIKITKTTSNCTLSIPHSSLIEKNSHLREVSKPENIFSNLKLNENCILTDTYDHVMPKIIHVDSPLVHKDHISVKLSEEMSHGHDIKKKENISFKMSDINLQPTNFTNIGIETPSDVQLSNTYDEKMGSFNVNKELFSDNLFHKKMCSESTQTDDHSNPLLVSSQALSLMNFNSVLKCKNSLPLGGKNDLKLNRPVANININGISISSNKNNMNNVESTELNMLDLEYYDRVAHESNLKFNETDNCVNNNNPSVNTYKDIKQVMKKINCDLEFFTKSNSSHTSDITNCEHLQFEDISNLDLDLVSKNNYSNTNDKHYHNHLIFRENNEINNLSSSVPKIHDEFQAELDMLDQLNDSLRDIEKMDCDSSIINNKQSIVDEMNGVNTSNDFNMKHVLNCSHSKNIPTHCSKLNSLSSCIMSVDKTITNFSIQMFEQLIKDEELRAKQHLTINSLREKSLVNRLTWEVTICDLQATFRNFKNPLDHLHEFQIFKQQHRGRLKKLENSLSQVKRLGRVIDSVYKRRIIMLEEHLQYLRMQSSSKKVIRKLNSLDHIPKKEENISQPLNTIFYKKSKNTTESFDTVESKTVHKNYSEPNIFLENNTSDTVFQTDKPKIILRNQATSPINIEAENFTLVDNIQVQTDNENSYVDKSVQTSNTLFDSSDNYIKNRKLLDTVNDLLYQNELLDASNSNDIRAVSLTMSTSPVKIMGCASESSFSTNSEQSEMDMRITTLQKQLEARKTESSRLRKKQKKLKLESLKAKEQAILKQIEMFDKKIEESRKSLMVEIEKKGVQVKNNLINHDLSSMHSITSNVQKQNIENEQMPEQHGQNISDNIKYNNYCVHQDKLMCEIQKKVSSELKENLNRFSNNDYNSEMSNNCLYKNGSLQPSETNNLSGIVSLHKKATVMEVVPLNSQLLEDVLIIHSLNDSETCSSQINETSNICDWPEKNLCVEKFTASYKSMNDDHLNKNSSKNSICQKLLFLDSNKNINNFNKKINNGVSQLEASNNETVVKSVDDKSPDFTSDGSSPKSPQSYKLFVSYGNMINAHNSDQDIESSYEEDRSEGDVLYDDQTFVEQYPTSDHDPFQDEKLANDKVDVITNYIFNSLIEDVKNTIKIKKSRPLSFIANNELNNLTEETPLLMILKREEEHQNMVILSEQAKSISDVLFKRNLQQIIYESLQVYLPKLNETEMDRLKLYLNWSSNRKKVKLSGYLKSQYKTSDVESDESFEIFYQNHQKQKISLIFQDENSDPTLAQQKAEKFKFPVKEIERPNFIEESQFFFREIPNKPPPPYKSPTKKKALDDIPYTHDEVRSIVLTVASQLFRNPQSSMSKNHMNNLDSNVHIDYKTLIFDYGKEIAQDMFFEEEKVPVWKKPMKKLKHFQGRPKNPEELSDAIFKKLKRIKDVDNCEEKVNAFVIKQMYEEDSKWVDFQMDEMNVQNDVVHSLMNKLISDTVKNMETNFYLKFM